MIIKQKQANAFAAHTGFVITRSGICQLHFQYATETIDIEGGSCKKRRYSVCNT